MKRSGDVTASAIVLFCGSVLMILMAVGMIAGAAVTPLPPDQRAVEFMVPIFYALMAAWGSQRESVFCNCVRGRESR